MWIESPLNEEGGPLQLRTFHNHRDHIEQLYGIKICCDRSDKNKYYIQNSNAIISTRLKIWMLQTLSITNIIQDSPTINDRILFPDITEGKQHLYKIIEAIKNDFLIDISYRISTQESAKRKSLAPYCAKFFHNCWHLLVKDVVANTFEILELDNIEDISLSDRHFIYPHDFSAKNFLKDIYGVTIDNNTVAQSIAIRAGKNIREQLRMSPIHQSQEEVDVHKTYSVFIYYLRPNADFLAKLLSYGASIEVISPNDLRTKMATAVKKMNQIYNDND